MGPRSSLLRQMCSRSRTRIRSPSPSEIPVSESPRLDAALSERIHALCEEGRDLWHDFDIEVRQDHWHSFVAADYNAVQAALLDLRSSGARFLEWGSATGVVTIMADLLGFDASGIELDPSLVQVARELAERTGSKARFAAGSFIPLGWAWSPPGGDGRSGTIGAGTSGYLELGRSLDEYDVVYGYPWSGEEDLMLDLMRAHGREDARLLLYTVEFGTKVYRGGKLEV